MTALQLVNRLLEADRFIRYNSALDHFKRKWAYRGIAEKQLNSLFKSGLQPTSRVALHHEFDRIGFPVVWFTSNPDYAQRYGEYVIRFPWPKNALVPPHWEAHIHSNRMSVPFPDEDADAIDSFIPPDSGEPESGDPERDREFAETSAIAVADGKGADEWIIRHTIPPNKIEIKFQNRWLSLRDFRAYLKQKR